MALSDTEKTELSDVVEGAKLLAEGVNTDLNGLTDNLPDVDNVTADAIVSDDGIFPVLFKTVSDSLKEIADNGYITNDAIADVLARVTPNILEQSLNFALQSQRATYDTYTAKLNAQNMALQQLLLSEQVGAARAQAVNLAIQCEISRHNEVIAKHGETTALNQSIASGYSAEQEQYNLQYILPARKLLLDEQAEQAHAATANTRINGSPVTGSVGKQIELFDQQIASYKNADLVKFMQNVHINTWTVRKSTDSGVAVPEALSDTNFNEAAKSLADSLGIPITLP